MGWWSRADVDRARAARGLVEMVEQWATRMEDEVVNGSGRAWAAQGYYGEGAGAAGLVSSSLVS
jgi:hypothetical protein